MIFKAEMGATSNGRQRVRCIPWSMKTWLTTEDAEETEESQKYPIVFFVWFVSFVVTYHAGYAMDAFGINSLPSSLRKTPAPNSLRNSP